MGPGYKYEIHQGYKAGMSHMVLVKTNVSRPPDGSFNPEMYSGVELNDQGRTAALLLSCDDKITEVVYFVMHKFKEVEDRKAELESLI
ncbi:hypothetical protein KI387_033781, partial [Taxus chinensis]